MRRLTFAFTVAGLLAIQQSQGAFAQAANGSNNGNGNIGLANGNGNGNGNGNASQASSAVTFNGRRNTPAVVAPGLAAAGVESCLGSTSVGGAGAGFGVTIAGTMTDKGCNIRLYSRTLYATGHPIAATQILCNDPDVADALAVEGVRCLVGVGAERQRAAAAPPVPGFFDRLLGCETCGDKASAIVAEAPAPQDARGDAPSAPPARKQGTKRLRRHAQASVLAVKTVGLETRSQSSP